MENQVIENESAVKEQVASPRLRVYKKKSTFKGATENDFWFSATRSDGNSVMCKFKNEVESDSMAFEISEVVGTMKEKTVVVQGETYKNYTYYITSCKFHEIEGTDLPL